MTETRAQKFHTDDVSLLRHQYGISALVSQTSQGRPGGLVIYQYTRKKIAEIPKYTQNYTQVYFIPEIQRK